MMRRRGEVRAGHIARRIIVARMHQNTLDGLQRRQRHHNNSAAAPSHSSSESDSGSIVYDDADDDNW